MIRVLLADDQALVRTGFRMIVQNSGDMEVVGEASDGAAAATAARELRPDVVLMDVRMPNVDGVEATRRICAAGDTARILILTTFDLDEYVYAALQAGASGFLLKDILAPDLLSAIRAVARGDAVIAPTATRRLLERYVYGRPGHPAHTADLSVLTEREREVLGLVAHGLSNIEIAGRLYLSDGQDSRQPHAVQTRPARPRAGGDLRVRMRLGPRPLVVRMSHSVLTGYHQPRGYNLLRHASMITLCVSLSFPSNRSISRWIARWRSGPRGEREPLKWRCILPACTTHTS